MNQYEKTDYSSFNDFFIRKFRPEARTFTQNSHELAAFAEGRYLAFEKVNENTLFPVKGMHLSAEVILGNSETARLFKDGPCIIARLCPTDYHRYHYPDDGITRQSYSVGHKLHSVNPIALRYRSDIFAINERKVSILQTKNFGEIAYVEVGALCVGRIVQTHSENAPFKRGDEKGYFLFGGSTVIVFGQKGVWRPSEDILNQTHNQTETFIQLGDSVATKV